jgi:(4S)-4-hydroxy-5-phosphonooxypentane-2,3-dione isomerase
MFVTLVHVHVKAEHLEEFIEVTGANHEGSVREPGNLRFDVLQLVEDRTRFILYEAYRDEAAAKAHKETRHYAEWRDAVADWLVEPRVGVRYDGLLPEQPESGL